jgi:hypothetical protein
MPTLYPTLDRIILALLRDQHELIVAQAHYDKYCDFERSPSSRLTSCIFFLDLWYTGRTMKQKARWIPFPNIVAAVGIAVGGVIALK